MSAAVSTAVDRLAARFDHHDPEFTPDTALAVHRRLREHGEPVHSSAHGGIWVLARYAHVRDALRDHERFSSAHGVFYPRAANQPRFAPLEYDPPEHTSFRALMRPALAAPAVRTAERRIDELAAEFVRPLVRRGAEQTVDLVAELTTTLPLAVLSTVIGFSDAARGSILELTRSTWTGMARGSTDFWPAFAALLDDEIARARRTDDGTYLSALVRTEFDGAPVTDEQLRVMLVAFAIAGHETTMNTAGHLLLRLASDPSIGADPDRHGAAVDETLRLDTPVDHGSRVTTSDVVVGSTTIPAGSRVLLAVGAANRDPERFDDPDVLRLDRGAAAHLSLGQGIHYCLGAQLGRRQLLAVLGELSAVPMRLDGPVRRYYANGRHLNLAALPVRFG